MFHSTCPAGREGIYILSNLRSKYSDLSEEKDLDFAKRKYRQKLPAGMGFVLAGSFIHFLNV